jgi:hypothetical protein
MKIQELISNLNQEVYDLLEITDSPFTYGTDGYVQWVDFYGVSVWCSEDDERTFDEDLNEYEPMRDHLLRVIADSLEKSRSIVHALKHAQVAEQVYAQS